MHAPREVTRGCGLACDLHKDHAMKKRGKKMALNRETLHHATGGYLIKGFTAYTDCGQQSCGATCGTITCNKPGNPCYDPGSANSACY
jgi:hypothetical protein